MYTEKDYLLRLIHEIIRTLFKLLLGKDIEERPALSSENEETYHTEHDFSRKEVWEGITFIAGRYGCGEFVAMFAKNVE